MARHLGPGEAWPTHSRPEARDALEEAAAAGWHLRPSTGHTFGRLTCPHLGQPGACIVVVYSTAGPADGSETAKVIRRALRRCPHQPETSAPQHEAAGDRVFNDEQIQRRVERLLEVIVGLDRRDAADDRLDDAIARDDVEAFEEHQRQRTVADNSAQTAWAALGRPLGVWPPEERRSELLDDVERWIERVTDPEVAARLRARAEDVARR